MKKDKQSFFQLMKRFLEPVKAYPVIYRKASASYILRALLPLLTLLLLEHITKAIELGDKELFTSYLWIFVIAVILYNIIVFLIRKRSWVEIRTLGFKKLYPIYIKKFLKLDNTHIEKIGTGRMISIMEQGFKARITLIERIFWHGIEIIVFLAFICYSILKINFWYLIIFIIIVALIQVFISFFGKKIRKSKYKESGIKSERSRSLIKIIMSKFEIQQQDQYQREIKNLDKHTNDLYQNILGRINHVHAIFFLPEFMGAMISFIVFFIVGYGTFNGEFSFSVLVLFAGVLTLLNGLIHKLTTFIKDFINDFATIEKLRDTFDAIPIMEGYDKGEKFIYKKGYFELKNISFAYDNKPVFQDFSLKIKGGTKTAFVGESGGGKTTLIKLLAGYIKPDQGKITIDKQTLYNIKKFTPTSSGAIAKEPLSEQDISLKSYYKHIGYLSQEPSIFDGTIRENLLYGVNSHISTSSTGQENSEGQIKTLKKIIKLAKCDFIREFEKGLDTEIGERGVRLSGGQKQRLAIAKIMLKNPDIVLLDEPTSALDSFNEELITEALHNLFKGKTVIIVAHRLQTVKEANKILFLENGKIIEQGTHKELIKQKGKYRKMLELQSGF